MTTISTDLLAQVLGGTNPPKPKPNPQPDCGDKKGFQNAPAIGNLEGGGHAMVPTVPCRDTKKKDAPDLTNVFHNAMNH